jgi:hypothetical protein
MYPDIGTFNRSDFQLSFATEPVLIANMAEQLTCFAFIRINHAEMITQGT